MQKYDYNLLKQNAFTFTLERIPQTMFRVVACTLPSITVPAPEAGFPGVPQFFPGMSTEFSDFSIDFLVDENLSNYEEMYNWLVQQRFATDFVPKVDNEVNLVSDGMLVTLTNSSNPNRIIHFKDMFPIAISGINFDTSVDDPQPVTCSVQFKFSYFVLNKKT